MGAYLLSELFRNIKSTIGPLLQQEFALDAATLDLMTSLFLFAVAGSQIFTGILLDRLGARRTVTMLLIIASIGGPAVCRRNFYNFATLDGFLMQYGIGAVVNQWVAIDGIYPAAAHITALVAVICVQLAALVWWLLRRGPLNQAVRDMGSACSCQ